MSAIHIIYEVMHLYILLSPLKCFNLVLLPLTLLPEIMQYVSYYI